jgi:hypothetical protein
MAAPAGNELKINAEPAQTGELLPADTTGEAFTASE